MAVCSRLAAITPAKRPIQSEQGPVPKPIQILTSSDHSHGFNDVDLTKLLLREDVKNKKVVVVSVAGSFRKGKSFLLDFFLRYMRASGAKNWLGNDDTPLQGFSWKGGSERDTSGILIWNEVFKVKTPSGEEVAVLLMDTQGVFDSKSTVKDCATIFALSIMTSSIQVYNLSQNIQENDLQHLQLFTEYGRVASENEHQGPPFQKLVFVVRDWSYPYEAPYGLKGGQKIIDRRLEISSKEHSELQQLRRYIRSCFSKICCFLLPHPGLKVATSPVFDGRNRDINHEFKKQLLDLVPSLLAPENLVKKQIDGQDVTCKELLEYIRAYVKVFSGNQLPEPKTLLNATAEANNLAAVSIVRDFYTKAMENLCGGNQPYISSGDLHAYHLRLKTQAREQFEGIRKMGGEEFSLLYLERLMDELEVIYMNFEKQNAQKNVFVAMRTPACLFSVVVLLYLVSGILSLFSIRLLAGAFSFVIGMLMVLLISWTYVQYSGDMRKLGQYIDISVNLVWMHIVMPTYRIVQRKQPVDDRILSPDPAPELKEKSPKSPIAALKASRSPLANRNKQAQLWTRQILTDPI